MTALTSTGSSCVAVAAAAVGNEACWDAGVDSLCIHRVPVPC